MNCTISVSANNSAGGAQVEVDPLGMSTSTGSPGFMLGERVPLTTSAPDAHVVGSVEPDERKIKKMGCVRELGAVITSFDWLP